MGLGNPGVVGPQGELNGVDTAGPGTLSVGNQNINTNNDLGGALTSTAADTGIVAFSANSTVTGFTGTIGSEFLRVDDFFRHVFSRHLGVDVPAERFHFINHHVAHAVSAFACSGFEQSLVLTIDGVGEGESGRVALGDGTSLETLRIIRPENSLGHFYVYGHHQPGVTDIWQRFEAAKDKLPPAGRGSGIGTPADLIDRRSTRSPRFRGVRT